MKKLLTTMAKSILFFVGWVILVSLLPIPNTENAALWRFFAELIPLLCITALTIAFGLFEKKKLTLNMISSPFRSSAIGLVAGLIWILATTCIFMIFGLIKVVEYRFISMLWLWIFSVFINTIMQEMLVRGYLYQILKTKYHMIVATIVTTGLFTLMHGGAFEAGIIPVLNILTMSLLMTIVLEYTQSLIAPIMMHFIWNGFCGLILDGINLSDDYPHLFVTEFTGNQLLSGGAPKMEGSIIVLLVNVTFIVGFVLLLKKKKQIQNLGKVDKNYCPNKNGDLS